jgi:hypothetical protein
MMQDFETTKLTGESTLIPLFKTLEISIADVDTGKLKDIGELYLELADRFSKMDPAQAYTFGNMMHIPPSVMTLLIRGRGAVQAMLDEQKRLGVVTKEDAAATLAYHQALTKLDTAASTVGRRLFTTFAPALIFILDKLDDFVVWINQYPGVIEAAFVALTAVVNVLSFAIGVRLVGAILGAATVAFRAMLTGLAYLLRVVAVAAVDAFPALADAIWAVAAAFDATPIGLIILGIAALSVAGYELIKNWKWIRDQWVKFWDDIWDATKRRQEYDAEHRKIWAREHGDVGAWHPGSAPPARAAGGFVGGSASRDDAWAAAVASERQYGIPAKVTFAQWELESGSGKHLPPGSNNPFGIKAVGNQPSVGAWTTEVDANGASHRVFAQFRKFDTLADAFAEHARLLATSPRYANARQFANDPDRFADALTGVYASDPGYGTKLRALIDAITMTLASGGGNTTNNRSSVQTSIGQVTVHTKATDADGIARDIKPALKRNNMAAQANYGQS